MNQTKLLITAIIVLVSFGVFFKSCSKSEDDKQCQFEGEVIKYVAEKCGCCPGWVVVAGNDTLKFETIPQNEQLQGLVNMYGYPISIKFSYINSTGTCADYYKEMTCIELPELVSCTKAGSIIGYDYTECLCCPGWLIKVDSDTIKAASLPNENVMWNFMQGHNFPVSVMIDFEDLEGTCSDSYKKVTCITIVYGLN